MHFYKMFDMFGSLTNCNSQLRRVWKIIKLIWIPEFLSAVLPVGSVVVGTTLQIKEDPFLQVGLDVLPLTAAAISSEQVQHLGAEQNRLKVALHQGLQQRAGPWIKTGQSSLSSQLLHLLSTRLLKGV